MLRKRMILVNWDFDLEILTMSALLLYVYSKLYVATLSLSAFVL